MLNLDSSFTSQFDRYYSEGTPFLFIIDFDGSNAKVLPFDAVDPAIISYRFQQADRIVSNTAEKPGLYRVPFSASHVCYQRYLTACRHIQSQQYAGESYLANLTFPSYFETGASLRDIFDTAKAPFKLYYSDHFCAFSPERFVTITKDTIETTPMKGTIDASLPDARQTLLDDPKESAEHLTIVDLLRNDLSLVCDDVSVASYRYFDTIRSPTRTLLQTSSCIRGSLSPAFISRPSEVFARLLPAGSVTGAPKKRTVEIITHAEGYERGYYTGVFGYFDGNLIDSAVTIRYLERIGSALFYKSGGGITIYSDPACEYQEMKDKVYVPLC